MAITPTNDTLYIKEITLPTGSVYKIVDYEARETIDTMTTTISSISSNVNSISTNVNSVSSTVNSLSGTVNSISGNVNSVSSNLNSLSGTVNNMATTISSISSTVNSMSKYTQFLGVTDTELTDGTTSAVVHIGSANVTATVGSIVIKGSEEFIFTGTGSNQGWKKFGDLSALGDNLGDLAYKDSATGSHTHITAVNIGTATVTSNGKFTPAGTINTGTSSLTSKGNYTPSGSVSFSNNSTTNLKISSTTTAPATANRGNYWNYTPEGTISITSSSTGSTSANVFTSITGRNVVASISTAAPASSAPTGGINYTSITDHNLKLGYLVPSTQNAISASSKADVIKTIGSITGTFTGQDIWAQQFTVTIPSEATFTGTAATISVTGTVISSITFSGTQGDISVTSTSAFVHSVTTTTGSVSITVS